MHLKNFSRPSKRVPRRQVPSREKFLVLIAGNLVQAVNAVIDH
jgi:hypothetical protein